MTSIPLHGVDSWEVTKPAGKSNSPRKKPNATTNVPKSPAKPRLWRAGIDPCLCIETFIFGKDGKPLYVRGPNESISHAQSIGRRVAASGGDFFIPLGPPPASGAATILTAVPADKGDAPLLL